MLARLVLFVLAVTVLGVLGASRELALIGGLLVSVLLSYVLLRRLRDAATIALVDRVQARTERRRAARGDEDALIEDAQVDAQADDKADDQADDQADDRVDHQVDDQVEARSRDGHAPRGG